MKYWLRVSEEEQFPLLVAGPFENQFSAENFRRNLTVKTLLTYGPDTIQEMKDAIRRCNPNDR